jgi:hypothetical protein
MVLEILWSHNLPQCCGIRSAGLYRTGSWRAPDWPKIVPGRPGIAESEMPPAKNRIHYESFAPKALGLSEVVGFALPCITVRKSGMSCASRISPERSTEVPVRNGRRPLKIM